MIKAPSEPKTPPSLPKGRHNLPREVVAQHQRERIVAAVATILAEHGSSGLTVERVIRVAGVSRSTFYVHFTNKQEATLAAHELIFTRFLADLTAACSAQAEWPMKVSAAIGAVVDFAVSRPEQTQILSIGALIADLTLADRISGSHDQLATLLSGVRPHSPNAAALPECTEEFLVAAIAAIISRHLALGQAAQLRSLQAELVELTLIPYYGAGEAARLAGRSG
jgi:AcrR family transcriptional regulator